MNAVTAGSVKVRHTKITITYEGCIDCGNSTGSYAWYPALVVPVKIGNKEFEVTLSRCGDCEKRSNPLFTQAVPADEEIS